MDLLSGKKVGKRKRNADGTRRHTDKREKKIFLISIRKFRMEQLQSPI
jgi:hypothetical protein